MMHYVKHFKQINDFKIPKLLHVMVFMVMAIQIYISYSFNKTIKSSIKRFRSNNICNFLRTLLKARKRLLRQKLTK